MEMAGKSKLTSLSNTKDFTQDERELYAAPREGTLVFVLPTAIFQNKLGEGNQIANRNKE